MSTKSTKIVNVHWVHRVHQSIKCPPSPRSRPSRAKYQTPKGRWICPPGQLARGPSTTSSRGPQIMSWHKNQDHQTSSVKWKIYKSWFSQKAPNSGILKLTFLKSECTHTDPSNFFFEWKANYVELGYTQTCGVVRFGLVIGTLPLLLAKLVSITYNHTIFRAILFCVLDQWSQYLFQ